MLQLYWIPIRDWNGHFFPAPQQSKSCNYIESLLGIETAVGSFEAVKLPSCNYIESLLGIETKGFSVTTTKWWCCNYIESLLGIETTLRGRDHIGNMLQLYWIPIRDWNEMNESDSADAMERSCNYIESLLGIETNDDNTDEATSWVATILNPY